MSIVFIVTEGVSKQKNQPRVIRNRQAENEKRVSGGSRPLPCPRTERAGAESAQPRGLSRGPAAGSLRSAKARWAAACWGRLFYRERRRLEGGEDRGGPSDPGRIFRAPLGGPLRPLLGLACPAASATRRSPGPQVSVPPPPPPPPAPRLRPGRG